ncbi:uncharacterized protein si:ch211-221j21.3 [Esox lucius]|uniref:uncharacterized protein si:ch211-221j21.3 n=1 Tax=Esox lucius TaxID=8010 RepID=UPI0014772FC8|nr:uncharacterized protein si:ch211-221j21.3 [Esox lucius]
MECMTPLQKKRSHEGDLPTWNNCQAKRLCNGVASCIQVEYGAGTDCAMDTWDTSMQQQGFPNRNNGVAVNHPASNMMVSAVLGGDPLQRCPRCMAGEPGHMNHIMGY